MFIFTPFIFIVKLFLLIMTLGFVNLFKVHPFDKIIDNPFYSCVIKLRRDSNHKYLKRDLKLILKYLSKHEIVLKDPPMIISSALASVMINFSYPFSNIRPDKSKQDLGFHKSWKNLKLDLETKSSFYREPSLSILLLMSLQKRYSFENNLTNLNSELKCTEIHIKDITKVFYTHFSLALTQNLEHSEEVIDLREKGENLIEWNNYCLATSHGIHIPTPVKDPNSKHKVNCINCGETSVKNKERTKLYFRLIRELCNV